MITLEEISKEYKKNRLRKKISCWISFLFSLVWMTIAFKVWWNGVSLIWPLLNHHPFEYVGLFLMLSLGLSSWWSAIEDPETLSKDKP